MAFTRKMTFGWLCVVACGHGGSHSGTPDGMATGDGNVSDGGQVVTPGWKVVSSADHAEITAMWAISSTDYWAGSRTGALLHYDGMDWVQTDARAPMRGTRQPSITAIMGTGPGDVWAATDLEGVVGHYDGTTWTFGTVDPSVVEGSGSGLLVDGLWVRATDDVWVSGRYYVGTKSTHRIYRYNGTSWAWLTDAPNVDSYSQLGGTPGANGELWLAGGTISGSTVLGGAWRYGADFTSAFTGTMFVPDRIAVLAENDVWFSDGGADVRHWDGSQLVVDSPDGTSPPKEIYGLWGSGSTVWAVGDATNGHGAAYRHDGAGWSETATFLPEAASVLGGSAANELWACNPSEVDLAGACAQFDGIGWTPRLAAHDFDRHALFVASDGDVWAGDDAGLVQRGHDHTWEARGAVASASPGTLQIGAIWGTSSTDLWVTGNASSAQISHFDGATWTVQHTQAGYVYLEGLWGTGDSDIWAVGGGVNNDPWILHNDGSGWSDVSFGGWGALHAIWGTSASDVWAVGGTSATGGPRIAHYDGVQWRDRSDVPPGLALRAISGRSASDVWAGGDGATLVHYDGNAWSRVAPPFAGDITAVLAIPGVLWVTATGSATSSSVWRFDGTTWTMDVTLRSPIRKLVADGTRVWAVGDGGTIARRD
jgi:hypothetical protein